MTEHAYIHIPFCIRKCKYCAFVSGFDIKNKDIYINSLLKEIKNNYKNEKLKTLYIGGGTPSLLDFKDIEKLMSLLNYSKGAEITLEANPETVEAEKFKGFKDIGINRISLGVQTFNDKILKLIGRKHSEQTIYKAVDIIKNAGFKNISIDLIYGLINQDLDLLNTDIDKSLKLDIAHISTYGLKIEENSYFAKHTPKNIPDDELQAKMFLQICEKLKKNGFEHYEISNFSKPDYNSKHNCAYWQNKNYYGFGVNASGYEGNIRYKNLSDFEEYTKNPLKKEEETILSKENILEEEIFLGLRLKKGINIKNINEKFKINFIKNYGKIIKKYSEFNLLEINEDNLKLTEKGILLSNEILCEFIN